MMVVSSDKIILAARALLGALGARHPAVLARPAGATEHGSRDKQTHGLQPHPASAAAAPQLPSDPHHIPSVSMSHGGRVYHDAGAFAFRPRLGLSFQPCQTRAPKEWPIA